MFNFIEEEQELEIYEKKALERMYQEFDKAYKEQQKKIDTLNAYIQEIGQNFGIEAIHIDGITYHPRKVNGKWDYFQE